MTLGLLFLVLSGVFSFGWMLGSALGYQHGRHDAEELHRLQTELVCSIELDLQQRDEVAEKGLVTQGSLL